MIGIGVNIVPFINKVARAVADYVIRIVGDGGVSESPDCVNTTMSVLDSQNLLNSASLLIIPSGYKSGKAYAEIPTNGNGDLTWTRASDAWRTNADGLIQRVPWNLLTYSEDFSNAAWTKNASSVSTTSVQSPIGTNAFLYSQSNLSTNFINQPKAIQNTTNTFSIFVKKNVGSLVQLNLGAFNSTFNFDTESISNSSLMSFQRFTNGWYRLVITANPLTNTSTFLNIPSSGSVSDSVYIACSQLTEGSSAQTYFPTTDRLNVPRLSYMYGSCPALLLEPQRTNLALQSESFDNASWTKSDVTITTNTTNAPNGTLTADTMVEGTGVSTQHRVRQSVTISSGASYTASVYIKRLTGTRDFAIINVDSGQRVYYNMTTNTVANTILGSGTITNVGDGWYRLTVSGTSTSTSTFLFLCMCDGTSSTSETYTGNGTSSFAIWGAQLEVGAYPTTFIPTTTASATRIADSFSRSNIFTNGLITSSGGTWFVELRGNLGYTRDNASNSLIFADSIGSTYLRIRNGGATNARLLIQKGIVGTPTDLFLTTTDTVKIAIKWNGSTADVFVNGTKQVSATAFTATQLQDMSCTPQVPNFIQAMALHPTPLTDAQCIEITTL